MTPEIQQYLIYAAILLGGMLMRHFGIQIPGLPAAASSPPAPRRDSPIDAEPFSGGGTSPQSANVGQSIVKAIDARIALLEQRLTPSSSAGNDNLATALASLAHRLIDRQPPQDTTTTRDNR